MRVLILGIDALEHSLVEKWDLKHLKQKEYGKIIVPIYEAGGEPVTLVVWPCFITGKEPEEMGFDSPILYRQPLKVFLDKIFFPVSSFIKNDSDTVKDESINFKTSRKQKIISRFNFLSMKAGFGRYPTEKDIKAPTFFDNENIKTVRFHIPVYDESHTLEDHCNPRNNVIAALGDKSLRKEFDTRLLQEFKDRSKELLDVINDDWDLCMQYFYVLDGIQHVFFKNKLKIMSFYMRFNEFVGKVKEIVSDDTMILVISDHGQKNGLHTKYGFYSCNKKLGLNNPKISDFKDIIEEKIKQKT